jgi:hypothetical protein
MANAPDFVNLPGTTKEMRDRLFAAFDALANWRDEILTANERCLGNVLEQTSEIARSMGWSDEAVKATRQYFCGANPTDRSADGRLQAAAQIADRSNGIPAQFGRAGLGGASIWCVCAMVHLVAGGRDVAAHLDARCI